MTLFGRSKLVLFGSQVKEGKEFHEGLNQNLLSDNLHEIIGSETTLDQFELSRAMEYEGNYLDNYVVSLSENPTSRVGSAVQSRLTTNKKFRWCRKSINKNNNNSWGCLLGRKVRRYERRS